MTAFGVGFCLKEAKVNAAQNLYVMCTGNEVMDKDDPVVLVEQYLLQWKISAAYEAFPTRLAHHRCRAFYREFREG